MTRVNKYLPSSLTFGVNSKRLVPRSEMTKGFTLIELLVVVAIIAVLAVIAIAIFTGQQKAARDARRRGDIDAIAGAMEGGKVQGSNTYPVMTTTLFSSGQMPIDPTNTTVAAGPNTCPTSCQYCFSLSATPITNCPAATGGGTTLWNTTTAPAGWTASATWTVCANLESGTSICRSNAQ